MKALIISDIHSNIYSLNAIWDKEKDSDFIYCAGDLVDYGPFPKEVINWCRNHNILCVKGNHDEDVVHHYKKEILFEKIPEEKRTWIHHNAAQLDAEDIQYLENLPETLNFEINGIQYCMRHSFIKRSYETMDNIHQFNQFWSEHYPRDNSSKEKRVIIGHTHNQAIHYLENYSLWMNPGSTSYRPTRQTEDFSKHAHYITINDEEIQLKSVDYDLAPLIEAVKKQKLNEAQIKAGYRFFDKYHTE